ncbi:MAG: dephospho-CoA kinase [Actinobacteria bacterium]|nr:dephospho-CoA kinase [Actinomycetota bacterium]
MPLIGLTGGIASGKSTVAHLLADRGALIVDADQIARDVVRPGRPAHERIVERFGRGVVAEDGNVDRAKLASIVFEDPQALADLNAITHPEVGIEMHEQIERGRATGRVIVVDVPLLVEAGMTQGFDAILVVTADSRGTMHTLTRARSMSRVANELTRSLNR